MKLEFQIFSFDSFAAKMRELKEKKHFDYLVTIVGEDFGEEGLGCVYILENTETNERTSVKTIAKQVGDDYVIDSVIGLWRAADLLEREVFDFYGIKFLGHPHMSRLFLRSDFKGYPFRKNWEFNDSYTLEDDVESDYTEEYALVDGKLVTKRNRLLTEDDYVVNIGPQHPSTHGVLRLQTVLDGEIVKRIAQFLCGGLFVDQNCIDLHKLIMNAASYLLADAQELEVSITLLVHVNNIRILVVICVIEEKIEFVVSGHINCQDIRCAAVTCIEQRSVCLSIAVEIDQYLILLALGDVDLLHFRCFLKPYSCFL